MHDDDGAASWRQQEELEQEEWEGRPPARRLPLRPVPVGGPAPGTGAPPGVNRVFLLGWLAERPRWRRLPDGEAEATLTVCTDAGAECHSVRLQGAQAAQAGTLPLGSGVYVQGRLHLRPWPGAGGRAEIVAQLLVPVDEAAPALPQAVHAGGARQR